MHFCKCYTVLTIAPKRWRRFAALSRLGSSSMTITIRHAVPDDAGAIGRLPVAIWNETYRGIMPDAVLDGTCVSERSSVWRRRLSEKDRSGLFAINIALLDGEIVGFCACGPQRDEALLEADFSAEFQVINVLRAAQGRGIGRKLMAAMAGAIIDAGHRAVSLWVVEANPAARGFYRNLGGIECGRKIETRLDLHIAEIAYGWQDVGKLAARTER